MQRIWLDVAYREKDQAKAAGARWDPQARRWYAPRPGIRELEKWLPTPPRPARPARTEVSPLWPDDPAVLLRSATGTVPLPWAIRAPYVWFCHMCDSTCRAGEIQIATIQTRWLRRPMIVTQPIEWRHHLQRRGDVDWHLLAHITHVLEQALRPHSRLARSPCPAEATPLTVPLPHFSAPPRFPSPPRRMNACLLSCLRTASVSCVRRPKLTHWGVFLSGDEVHGTTATLSPGP